MSLSKILQKLDIDGNVVLRLKDAGVTSALGFLTSSHGFLVEKCSLTQQSIEFVKELIFAEFATAPVKGTDLYEETLRLTKILATGCDNLDELLDGGLFTGELLEIYGPPASGKTQVALFLASSVSCNVEANVLFFDTNSSFVMERLMQMIESKNSPLSPQATKLFLSRIRCSRVFEAFQLLSELEHLKVKLCSEMDSFCLHLKLIIVDSLPAVITPILGGKQQQGHVVLAKIGFLLKEIAHDFGIAVLVINNAVSKFGGGNRDEYRPSLGKSWLSIPHIRLFLYMSGHSNEERIVTVKKHHRMLENLSSTFFIGSGGLCSVRRDVT